MRIAISGSHATGKSTLARTFADFQPCYALVDEPYHVMVSEGTLFSEPPTAEDYEAQLERSASLITGNTSSEVIFERCPIDFLAYLTVFRRRGDQNRSDSFDLVKESVRTIDLIVYVPIEKPDRIDVAGEYPKLRRLVDQKLRAYLVDDELGIAPTVVLVQGSVQERLRQIVRSVPGSA